MFEKRKLYVMFEPTLNCNALTDHENAKNVYPVFKAHIDRLKTAFMVKIEVWHH